VTSQQVEEATRELTPLKKEVEILRGELQKSETELATVRQVESKRTSTAQSELDRTKSSLNGLTR